MNEDIIVPNHYKTNRIYNGNYRNVLKIATVVSTFKKGDRELILQTFSG